MDKKDGKISPVFETLAILDAKEKPGEAKVTIPTLKGVEDAKRWVDENEK